MLAASLSLSTLLLIELSEFTQQMCVNDGFIV